MKNNNFKKFRFCFFVFLLMILPLLTFAFVRGPDGYNYYDYESNYPIGGNIFGGSSGLFCFGSFSYPTFCSVVDFFIRQISKAIPILIFISAIVFVWGVFRYVIYEGEDRKKSRDVMLYGIIGLFVMVSVWGLVAVVKNTFGFQNNDNFFFNLGGSFGNSFGGGFYGGSNTTGSFSEFGNQFIR